MTAVPELTPAPPGAAAGAGPKWHYLLVAAVAGVVFFWNLRAAVFDEHEAKAALAGHGMTIPAGGGQWLVQSDLDLTPESTPADTPLHRWLIPINNGRPRLVKTPLPYWCIAGVSLALNERDEFTARLPEALGGLLCILVTLAMGRRLVGPRAGLIGAVMLATSLGVMHWGRNARPEMLLCFFITVAMYCFWRGLEDPTRPRRAAWMLAFWLAMGLANLCKQFLPFLLLWPLIVFVLWRYDHGQAESQPEEERLAGAPTPRRRLAVWLGASGVSMLGGILLTAWLWRTKSADADQDTIGKMLVMAVLVAWPLVVYAAVSRGWRGILPLLPTAVPGVFIMCACFLPWMAYMQHLFANAGDIFNDQVTERAAGTGGWVAKGAPWYYIAPLATLTLPWIGFLPGGFAVAWLEKFRARRRALMFLFLWSVGLIAVLTLSGGKREHYILPMLPAICLLMGTAAEDLFWVHRWLSARAARALAAGYAVVMLLAPLGMGLFWYCAVHAERYVNPLPIRRVRLDSVGDFIANLSFQPELWRNLTVATAVAALLGVVVLVLAMRQRFAWVLPLVVAGIVIIYTGYHCGSEDWDERAEIEQFARQSATLVGRDSVGSWGDPQQKTTYYFGRTLPNILLVRDRLKRQYGPAEAETRWQAWLKSPEAPTWLAGYDKFQERMAAAGYTREALRVEGKQERPTVFLLMRKP